jgi:hypothetical protein
MLRPSGFLVACIALTALAGDAPVLVRGEKLQGLAEVKLADLLAAPEKFQDKNVRLKGVVRRACERKGCWMELAETTDAKAAAVRVTMKGYAFFVPTDSAGSRAVVEGKVSVQAVSEKQAEHYESEGGTVPRDAAGKPREVKLSASGLELTRS